MLSTAMLGHPAWTCPVHRQAVVQSVLPINAGHLPAAAAGLRQEQHIAVHVVSMWQTVCRLLFELRLSQQLLSCPALVG
jgi:hypothetical protein